jgi:general secretion pathway protein C
MNFDTLKAAITKRRLAIAGGIAVVAVLLALGTSAGLARVVGLPDGASLTDLGVLSSEGPGESTVRGRSPTRKRTGSKRSFVEPIVKRNIFDPDAVGVEPEPGDPTADQQTDLAVRLLATVVVTPEIRSSALIAEDKRDGATQGYGIGDSLLGEGEIIKIEQKRVVIKRNNGDVEYLAMKDGDGKKKKKASKDDGDEEVTKEGDNKFVVERSLVEDAVENVEKLATQIRVVPHKGPDGEIDGYRLSAIRRGSLFDKLGVKNGDIVHDVNGHALTSADGALKAYQALQSDSNFTFEVTRRNKKQTFEYEVR